MQRIFLRTIIMDMIASEDKTAFSDPEKIIEKCGIHPGMDIADFGAGSGHYTLAVAKALLSTGRVYAIEVQKELLSKLKNQAARLGLYNVEVIWGDIEKLNGSKLGHSSVDIVLLSNVLFQAENRENVIKEIQRILKPRGKVLVVEWQDGQRIGPKIDRLKKEKVLEMFEKAGFHKEKDISAGMHHYGMLFKKL